MNANYRDLLSILQLKKKPKIIKSKISSQGLE